MQGGAITWRTFKASKEGMATIGFSEINWQQHVQFMSQTEALEFQGWAVGDVFVNAAGIYALHCPGAVTVYINEHMHAADVFHRNQVPPGTYVFTIWFSVFCMRSKAWLAACASLPLARLPPLQAVQYSAHARGCACPSCARRGRKKDYIFFNGPIT